MKHKISKLFLSLVLSAACAASVFAKDSVILEGSTTVLPLAQKTAELFMDNNPSIDISVRGGGSGVGINSLLSGRCNAANASRSIKESEIVKGAQKNIRPKAYVVAMDAIALIVNNKNSVKALSKQQVKDIFTGKIKNWKELGGADVKIVVVSRDSASGTFEAFNELALGNAKVSKDALMQASNQGVANIIATTEGAIGYVGLGYLGDKVKTVSVAGVVPSVETVLNNTYAYSRPLFMYTNGPAKGAVKQYIDFVVSKDGQKAAAELGFVPLK
ncbi:phosphate ABC transporter substrate-binding protein [Endomicrobium proavitum]|uniref:Phosphate-binding protein n=1 Tax=Endomicrobium proavitum TaxID=1408281 RepID=A0A0G3WJA2_9BACT|nr:phosphate ABC transporter substrate-binding protein [Endomicrobium proavitum]AKL98418.1 Phosphate ABC transporter phosphate-binding protein [Endomicrobium proavitum]